MRALSTSGKLGGIWLTYLKNIEKLQILSEKRSGLDLVAGPSATRTEETTQKKCDENCMPKVIKSLKEKYENSGRPQQIQILTIFTPSMSIRTMMSKFECSQRMAVQAKKMLSTPNPKHRKMLSHEVKAAVIEYYRNYEVSGIMPGKKDYVIVQSEKKVQKCQ